MLATEIRRGPAALTLRAVGGGAVSVLLGLLVGLIIVVFVATRFMGYRIATVQSFSMRPALDRGDLIVSRPVSISSAKPGEIILFEEGERQKLLVAHRVYNTIPVTTNVVNSTTGETSINHSMLLRTKGDANSEVDASVVDATTFKGRVILSVPRVGLVAGQVPLQSALFALTGVIGVAWITYEFRQHRVRSAARRSIA